jgi:2-phosphosulfolactate phosphatase
MKSLEVCLTPTLLPLHEFQGKTVVVVDIFRATSTMTAALSEGVSHIYPVSDLEECKSMEKMGYISAGERNGQKAEGFKLGNSPLEYLNGAQQGEKIAMTTTNGTFAINEIKNKAAEVLMGSFLNISATANYLNQQKTDLLILCAGWKGKFNLEDTLYAGALVSKLETTFQTSCDAAIASKTLYEQNSKDLGSLIAKASHTKRLQNHQIEKDIDFCLQIDKYKIIIYLKDGKLYSK